MAAPIVVYTGTLEKAPVRILLKLWSYKDKVSLCSLIDN